MLRSECRARRAGSWTLPRRHHKRKGEPASDFDRAMAEDIEAQRVERVAEREREREHAAAAAGAPPEAAPPETPAEIALTGEAALAIPDDEAAA